MSKKDLIKQIDEMIELYEGQSKEYPLFSSTQVKYKGMVLGLCLARDIVVNQNKTKRKKK